MFDFIQKNTKKDDVALREDLERRYGPAMAQDILDQLKKAEGSSGTADYLSVKTLSEGEEIYRREAQEALKRLKACKRGKTESHKGVVEFEGAFLQKEFERSFSFYLRFHKGYHVLYRQAMQAYKVKAYLYGLSNESNDDMPILDKSAYHAASEIMDWPDDLRKSLYHLTRQITKVCITKKKDVAA